MTDAITQSWMRDKSDDLAIQKGCYFDIARGAFTVWWIERYCRLYEGSHAGEPMLLRAGCEHLFDFEYPIMEPWDEGGEELSIHRAEIYSQWFQQNRDSADWQYETTMRMFGWAYPDKEIGRHVRRFRKSTVFISKKNKKTPTLSSWGLYLTCGDGEMGAKNFGAAKDGLQAQLALKHAMYMVEQSPELSSECKTNKNEKSISHLPTRSEYRPLTSAGENRQTSKEGLNGNLLIDELHVVDREYMSRISRAGISREEFLDIGVSTAGNNPDSYGKERFDEATRVIDGTMDDFRHLAQIYAAPQSLSDRELADDPIKWGRMANPAWGHTIRESEYLDDYKRSRVSISKLSEFKMYRLNIWSNTANQWLEMDKWLDCQGAFTLQDLAGKRAAIGMDLSRTRDMSALGIAIPVGDMVLTSAKLWITEAYADQHKDKVDFREWEKKNELFIIPGDTIKPQMIRDEFERLCKILMVDVLVYDKTYAAEFTEWCEEKYPRLTQIEYPQSSATMEKPIDDFEAAVSERTIQHDGNSCLTWQIGHCAVAEGFKGNRILKKPKRNDYRKIDGVVANVMAFWGTKHLPKQTSVYRRRGVIAV